MPITFTTVSQGYHTSSPESFSCTSSFLTFSPDSKFLNMESETYYLYLSPRRRFVPLEVSQPQEQRRFSPGVLPTNNSLFSIFREVTNQTPLFSVLIPQKPRLLSNRSLLPRTRHPFSSKKRTTTENTTSGTFFLLHQVPLLQIPVSKTTKTSPQEKTTTFLIKRPLS